MAARVRFRRQNSSEFMLAPRLNLGFTMITASLLLLASCQTPQPAAPPASSSAPAVAQRTAPEPPLQPADPPQNGGAAKADEGKEKHRNIPSRTFQLDDLKKAEIKIDDHKFSLWVMDTFNKRQEGMMFLENSDFKDNEGMIFLFKEPEYQRFWMRNTLVPLDIAYVSPSRKIINTYTMKALDEVTDYSSFGVADVVIELRAGTMRKLSIGRTSRVTLPANLKAKE